MADIEDNQIEAIREYIEVLPETGKARVSIGDDVEGETGFVTLTPQALYKLGIRCLEAALLTGAGHDWRVSAVVCDPGTDKEDDVEDVEVETPKGLLS